VKSLFSRFISLNKDKKPYIFVVCAPDYIAYNNPISNCLWANGNTIADLVSYVDPDVKPDVKPDGWELGLRNLRERHFLKDSSDASLLDWAINHPKIWDLGLRYSADEWSNETFTKNDFPRSNLMILDYVIENEDKIVGEDDKYTEEFMKFRTDFFNCLIKCLKQLRDEKFFETAYPEKVLINFEVREYYDKDEMIRIFECLNTKEEAELFAEYA
jgi:hypothetical protein